MSIVDYQRHNILCIDTYRKGKVRKAPTGAAGEFKKQSVKYTAQKLHEKGVILEIEGLPSHQYVLEHIIHSLLLFIVITRFKNAVFEIMSTDVGTFEVTGKFFGVSMEKVELVFQVCGPPSTAKLCSQYIIIIPY